ncbi:MAG: hypothetical protein EU547_01210 [Promethearchaeota archaeon]|nr:MAG: hypothetical protein EU547_01210 [Candidatus Lokiarchaeota archaeon]
MAVNEYLCISYFDNIIGPNTFYCNEDLSKDPESPNLGRILEFAEDKSTFILASQNFYTVNHIFFIESPYARGGKDLFMVSYLIRSESISDEIDDVFYYLDSKKPNLLQFVNELKKLEELPEVIRKNKGVNLEHNINQLGSKRFQKDFYVIFNKTYSNLSFKSKNNQKASIELIKKIFILGEEKVGKTNFLDQLKTIQLTLQEQSDLSTKIFEVILENVENLREECYDDFLNCKQCKIHNRCITQAQGFIIIFDGTHRKSIKQAKERYNLIIKKFAKYKPNNPIPILLIGNKFNSKKKFDTNFFLDGLNKKEAQKSNILTQVIELDLQNDKKELQNSFRWIIKKII